jgi:hypothetical protein
MGCSQCLGDETRCVSEERKIEEEGGGGRSSPLEGKRAAEALLYVNGSFP